MKKYAVYGFTLVELLVVIAIIGAIAGLLLPAVNAAREAGRRATCVSNMKQISFALINYHETRKSFPPGCMYLDQYASQPTDLTQDARWYDGMFQWMAFVLPFMEEDATFAQLDFTKKANASPNRTGASDSPDRMGPPVTRCPSAPRFQGVQGPGWQKDYGVNGGLGGFPDRHWNRALSGSVGEGRVPATAVFFQNSGTRSQDIKDGTSHTFLMLEVSHETLPIVEQRYGNKDPSDPIKTVPGKEWNYYFNCHHQSYGFCMGSASNGPLPINFIPYDDENQTRYARSYHVAGVNTSMCDGSVMFVPETIDMNIYYATFSRSGGNKTGNAEHVGGGIKTIDSLK